MSGALNGQKGTILRTIEISRYHFRIPKLKETFTVTEGVPLAQFGQKYY